MVNTTTTTAVQPLHIDAASILRDAEGELVAKLTSLERQQNLELKENKSTNPDKSSSNKSTNPDKSSSSKETEARSSPAQNTRNDATDSSKNKSDSQTMAQTMIKHFGPNAGADNKGSSSTAANVAEQGSKTNESKIDTTADVEKSKVYII